MRVTSSLDVKKVLTKVEEWDVELGVWRTREEVSFCCGTAICNPSFTPQTLVTPRYHFGFTSAPKATVCP